MKIKQVLPDNILDDIPLKKAICFRIEKKKTSEVIKFLKNYVIDYEKSAFYLDSKYIKYPNDQKENYKFGKYNLKNKNLIYKENDNFGLLGIYFYLFYNFFTIVKKIF